MRALPIALALVLASGAAAWPHALSLKARMLALAGQGRYPQALQLALTTLALLEAAGHAGDGEHVSALNNAAWLAQALGRYAEARPHYDRALALCDAHPGVHPELIVTLNNVAIFRREQGDFQGALPVLERALEVAKKASGARSLPVALCLFNLATLHQDLAHHAVARGMYLEAIAIQEAVHGKDHLDLAGLFYNLASLELTMGARADARQHAERALAIREARLGAGHAFVGNSCYLLAQIAVADGRRADARALFERGIPLVERGFGAGHANLGTFLDAYARLEQSEGNMAVARARFDRALAVLEKAFGPDHPDLADTRNNYAMLLNDLGEYDAARALLRRVVRSWELTYGQDHPDVAKGLNNLAHMIFTQGEPVEARRLFEQALALRVKHRGPEHADVAQSENNLAQLLMEQGDHASALRGFEHAAAIFEKQAGPEHPDLAVALNNLAMCAKAQGDHRRALALYERALAIWRKKLRPDHPRIAIGLDNLAGLLRAMGQKDRARTLLEQALAIQEKSGPQHPLLVKPLSNMASLLDPKAARPLLERALAIAERAHGPEHAQVASVLADLADLDGDRAKIARALSIQEKLTGSLLSTLSEQEKLRFLGTVRSTLDRFLALHDRPADHRLAYEKVLFWKGISFRLLRSTRRAVEASPDPQVRALFQALVEARGRLARAALSAGQDLPTLTAAKAKLERDLAARCRAFRAADPEPRPAALGESEALVDLFEFTRGGRRRMLAFVRRGRGAVERLDLGESAALEAALAQFRTALEGARDEERVRKKGRALAELWWTPMARLLSGVEHLRVAPDGLLAFCPFAALPVDGGRFLIETCAVTLVSSGADLVVPEPALAQDRLVAAGGVAYGPELAPLPGTLAEVEAIERLWRASTRPATVVSGGDATKARLGELAPGAGVLHVATHGFQDPGPASANPLLSTGLALAGARWTAEEVSGLSLAACRLVVLSACGSGLGERVAGQGVQGLTWAFREAGAGAVVASLWRVPDEGTRSLMEAFYRRLLAGAPVAVALRQAQLELLSEDRAKPGRPRLETWAAFAAWR